MKILMIGPSVVKAKGGMSTVIQEIYDDKIFENSCEIDLYESYVDGNKVKVALFSLWSVFKFLILSKAKQYDIYHLHVASYGSTFRKILYARMIKKQNKKLILHIHGGQYIDFYKSLSEQNKKRVLEFLHSADIVITLSEQWKSDFESIFKLKNCIVLENGIDLNKYSTAKRFPATLNRNFLFLGRVNNDKGVFDLIKAASIASKECPDLCVYIGGQGDIAGAQKLINEYDVQNNVKLIGWLDENKKLKTLSEVDTLILPSYYEALPMSILEAMSCGKSIISTKVGAIPEVVKTSNGILIDAGNIDELSKAMVKCCMDEQWMQNAYNANIDKMFALYNMEKKHNQLRKCYETLNESI